MSRDVARLRFAATACGDVASFRAYRRLDSPRRRDARETAVVRLRPLDGARVTLRAGTSDALSVRETFHDDVHRPPPEIEAAGVEWIIDLGANIGLTVSDNARRFPEARIVAVELDAGNATLCRRNIAPWGDRVELLEAAVWTDDGEVGFVREQGNEYGFYVVDGGEGTHRALAVSMASILDRVPAPARVSWMKMDIEGVEARLLSPEHSAWAERVDAIGLQIHVPYSFAECLADLRALGFDARVDPRRPDFVLGVRR